MSSSVKGRDVNSLTSIQRFSDDHGVATLQDALRNGFGEAVVAREMPEPCQFPSRDSLQLA